MFVKIGAVSYIATDHTIVQFTYLTGSRCTIIHTVCSYIYLASYVARHFLARNSTTKLMCVYQLCKTVKSKLLTTSLWYVMKAKQFSSCKYCHLWHALHSQISK